MVSASVSAEPLDPYVPPPFTEFPDEPTDLPPPRNEATTPSWSDVVHALRHQSSVRVVAGAEAPLELAAGLELVVWRIRIGSTLGELPRSVERAVNDTLVAHNAYARSLGDLVVASMQRVVMWRGYVTVEPWPTHGLLACAGLSTAWISGSATPPQVATAVGMALPDGVPIGNTRFAVSSRLHLFDAELGWEWRWQRWSVQLDLGVALATSARTRASVQPAISDPRFFALADRATSTLDHAFTTYVKTPILATLVSYEL